MTDMSICVQSKTAESVSYQNSHCHREFITRLYLLYYSDTLTLVWNYRRNINVYKGSFSIYFYSIATLELYFQPVFNLHFHTWTEVDLGFFEVGAKTGSESLNQRVWSCKPSEAISCLVFEVSEAKV